MSSFGLDLGGSVSFAVGFLAECLGVREEVWVQGPQNPSGL